MTHSGGQSPQAAAHDLQRQITVRRRTRDLRYFSVCALLTVAVFLAMWGVLTTGDIELTYGEVLRYLLGDPVDGAEFALGEMRLPRAIVGALSGLAFGMSGYASQTLLRNQLASPDIIGITFGASAAAVWAILVLNWSGMAVALLALPAGLLTAALIYLISSPGLPTAIVQRVVAAIFSRGNARQVPLSTTVQGARLILIGIGVSAMLTSVIEYVQLKANAYDIAESLRWLSGSLSTSDWAHVPFVGIGFLVFATVLLWQSRQLMLITLGQETATGLGVNVGRATLVIILGFVGLSSVATAATGPIAFLPFLSGPIAALLVGRCDRSLLIPAALTGAFLVLAADLAGQTFFAYRLPVGVVTSLVGAPYMLMQLVRINRQGRSA